MDVHIQRIRIDALFIAFKGGCYHRPFTIGSGERLAVTTYLLAFAEGRCTKLYRQTTGIPMGTNCASLVADLFLFCYERDFMKSLSRENQADIIQAFNSTSRYLDD